jgi:hypothetical protein
MTRNFLVCSKIRKQSGNKSSIKRKRKQKRKRKIVIYKMGILYILNISKRRRFL